VQQSPRLAPPYGGRAAAVSLGRLVDVYLFVTNDCNLRCTHCYVSSGDCDAGAKRPAPNYCAATPMKSRSGHAGLRSIAAIFAPSC